MPDVVLHPNVTAWLAGFADRVARTYVQAFLALLLVGPTIDASTAQIAAMAAIPAALTAILAAIPGVVTTRLPFWLDVAARAGRTFLVSFVGYLIALPVFRLDRDVFAGAVAVAVPAAIAVVMAALSKNVGDHGTAAALPAELDPTAVPAGH